MAVYQPGRILITGLVRTVKGREGSRDFIHEMVKGMFPDVEIDIDFEIEIAEQLVASEREEGS